jgi:hypothetical protein
VGRCCAETVDSQTSQATMNYLAALNAFKMSGCPSSCPAIPCPNTPSNVCGSDGYCQ